MADQEKPPGRPMKYAYTMSAKIAQFPFRFYVNNCWMFRYYLIGVAVSMPIFYKIQKLSYNPDNVKKWEEIRRLEREPQHH